MSPLMELMNNIIYQGSENVLILSRVYTTSFTCQFDLALYPFDEQKCLMIFASQVFNAFVFSAYASLVPSYFNLQ